MVSSIKKNRILMDSKENQSRNDYLKNGDWTLEQGFEQFNKFCLLKNLREKTLVDYKHAFNRFNEFVLAEGDCFFTGDLVPSDVENYIIHLRSTGMRETSVNTYLRGLRTYLNFLNEQDACIRIKIPIYKADKKVKETYTDNELFKLLKKPSLVNCSFSEYRNWVIVNFFLATGVRVSTLVNIKIEDLDFDYDRIHLMYTKNRKSCVIPMSKQLKDILLEYLSIRKGETIDYLFCNQFGESIAVDGVIHAIAKYNRSRGVNRVGLHAFRHTFAKRCVLNGVNVFVLQRLMGHTDIAITKEYVDLYADDLARNIEKYNPLDTLGEYIDKNKNKKSIEKKKKISIR